MQYNHDPLFEIIRQAHSDARKAQDAARLASETRILRGLSILVIVIGLLWNLAG
jgi:hypothetical protein